MAQSSSNNSRHFYIRDVHYKDIIDGKYTKQLLVFDFTDDICHDLFTDLSTDLSNPNRGISESAIANLKAMKVVEVLNPRLYSNLLSEVSTILLNKFRQHAKYEQLLFVVQYYKNMTAAV